MATASTVVDWCSRAEPPRVVIVDSGISPVKTTVTGVTAFASWRGAYLSKQVSVTNMILIPMYWFKALLFGRDISRF